MLEYELHDAGLFKGLDLAWTLTLATATPASKISTKINTSLKAEYLTCSSGTTTSSNPQSLDHIIQQEYALVITPAIMSEGTGTDDKLSSMDHAEVHYFNR